MKIEPFQVSIEESSIDDLKDRLNRTRWPDEIVDSGWSYGSNLSYMKELVDYWANTFNWRAAEAKINSFRNFRATVDGLNIHFIHERGKGPNPTPIVITHGWPGSFVEMFQIIPLLTDPASHGGETEDSFDVVVPSLPGYGFSERPSQPGMNARRIAEMWQKLMLGLGYERFGAQGGDWGASVTTMLGFGYPHNVIGIHLNYVPGSYRPYLGPDAPPLSENELAFQETVKRWWQDEGAYAHQQSTYPQTLSYGLNDSPTGLAAWITEKFRTWSDCDGNVESRFSKDELLTNISTYWFTQTIGSSTRLYYEALRKRLHFGKDQRVTPPCAVAHFPKELPAPPREWVERVYNVQRWTPMPRGGHFAAMEEPELLANDVREFFASVK